MARSGRSRGKGARRGTRLARIALTREQVAKVALSQRNLYWEYHVFLASLDPSVRPPETLPKMPKGRPVSGIVVVFMDFMMGQYNHLRSELNRAETTKKAFEDRFTMFKEGRKAFQYYFRGVEYIVMRDGSVLIREAELTRGNSPARSYAAAERELQQAIDMALLRDLRERTARIAAKTVPGATVSRKKGTGRLGLDEWVTTTKASEVLQPHSRYAVTVATPVDRLG